MGGHARRQGHEFLPLFDLSEPPFHRFQALHGLGKVRVRVGIGGDDWI